MEVDLSSAGAPSASRSGPAALTIKNLTTFFWLARHRNYHAVAAQLNVTQPAVSSRISALEDALGIRLFFATARRWN